MTLEHWAKMPEGAPVWVERGVWDELRLAGKTADDVGAPRPPRNSGVPKP